MNIRKSFLKVNDLNGYSNDEQAFPNVSLKIPGGIFNTIRNSIFLLLVIFILSGFSPMHSQQIELLTVDRLNERIKHGKDTTYVVNFWATWCAPCIKEIPHFETLQQEKKDDKLKVLLVSVDFQDRLEKSVIPFVKKSKLKNEVFLPDETDQQVYIDRIDKTWSGAIPATLFIKGRKRKFVEKEFTYPSLLSEYRNFK